MIKISVIVPVYNVGRFIERCARSLFEQTLEDIEIIFVDDCSPDNSIDLVKGLLENYPTRRENTIFCRHEVNKGLPTARQTGLQVAHGEYIAHCDSDDWVEKNMYERLYSMAKEGDYDIVYCDYFKSNGYEKSVYNERHYKGGDLMLGPVWNKLVKRCLYNGVVFPKYNKAEDGVIMMQLSFFASTVEHLKEPLYYYFMNPDSICRVLSKEACLERWKQECNNVELRLSFLKEHNVENRYHKDIIIMKYYANYNLVPYLTDDNVYQLWRSNYPELSKELNFFSSYPFRLRLAYYLSKLRLMRFLKRF